MAEPLVELETDVLVVGSGAAGMAAALSAAEAGARVLLADRSLVGRSGATVMAQMTVAVALGSEQPDHWEHHLADTIAAGRGLCDADLAEIVCREGPEEIRRLDGWKVGWARHEDGRIRQAQAPGHDRPRCVYVDFLSTGPAVAKTLRGRVLRQETVTRVGDLYVADLPVRDGTVRGAVGFSMADGRPVAIAAGAVVLATGGLTRLYRRNSASANMGGDGHALALRAGAELMDMEFVQFFPIGHLAPRLVGMDPIMWDPFRYKLGGRLLNAEGREFVNDYGNEEGAVYNVTRDKATHAILSEVQAGRGSPAGGAFLSFEHVPEARLREAFGPVIDRLAKNGIDLTRMAVEVAPIAHYHMGGVRVDAAMETRVPGLFVAGETVAGANGANRLSGNAITEALVFGRRAGESAARRAEAAGRARPAGSETLELIRGSSPAAELNLAGAIAELQALMAEQVGPFRTAEGLEQALAGIAALRRALGERPPGAPGPYDLGRLDWFDLRSMLLVAEAVTTAALARRESRGAHQRDDFPLMDDAAWRLHQTLSLKDGALALGRAPVQAPRAADIEEVA
ncbi:succinate dehydrogenase / fumarate reductase flavoprotein subunit/fumarate reductase (CoM/CoB) subunit A [Tistlia consotensis]|uniref:Succinate dehydrogenase / fumarate reductase flavoprotein subunit/fumarate reductase (CoM/CoB) subunit A n=1 Tax=Tistlia consotensis USBA 355 TaxID=560819 RepID=A0A1Y6CK51_9PROT|nr:FAD-binding protein [Tistlia consotensis]SMF71810.1 succinate dehydrogenase / fumarate reductase flavoprotein subunit/fumarate reductase (CoM/CoB) subunit A [Tistlia consotensis USBA 355]SNS06204.1 succinate dehydrogenase / fumarate reductase flavoprotein subunit/fumarate reductase (CoM/CoB) subunit A [Tistlia consotensis]